MIDPVIFEIGPLQLRWYGVLVTAGGLAGFSLVSWKSAKYGISKNIIGDLALIVILAAIFGARLFYVLRFWEEEFVGQPLFNTLKVWKGGLVFQGGFIFAAIAIILYLLYKHVSIGAVGDLFALGLPLAHAIGRIGCLINGCCFGFMPYDGPFAVHYPFLAHGAFPAQAVESAGNLLVCLGILLIDKLNWAKGKRFLIYMAAYTILRFAVEPLRGDYPLSQRWHGMTPGQYHGLWQLPLIIMVFAACTWYCNRFSSNKLSTSVTDEAKHSRHHSKHK